MKKLITLSVLLFSTRLIFGQDTAAPKPIIKSYSANQNYFNVGAVFEGMPEDLGRSVGGQLSYQKSINELFSIGLDGSFSKGKAPVVSSFILKYNLFDFYPHVSAHALDLLNFPKYLDLYLTLGLKIRFVSVTNNEFESDYLQGQGTYLSYGIGAKYQISPKTGFFLDYKRYNSFAVGLSFAIDKKK
jgi:hypothetical protein